ncbi:MAG: hypothetical protein QOE70_17 [Chthoniobacter sp.]|jgi:hypothetical protein|nr:hypothetical protein [Chthoniobacter sp.]
MGLLKPFSREQKPLRPDRLPNGCFTLHREGKLVASTLPSSFPLNVMAEIGGTVLEAFSRAQSSNLPLTELNIHYSGLTITARELRGGALIFLQPATLQLPTPPSSPAMHYKNLDEFVIHLENYIECWKQFNHYVNLAREKKFSRDDENQFLEIKSVIAQGLEAILASIDKGGPKKEEVHQLFGNASSLRHLADHPDTVTTVETQWHRVYLGLQSLLGQLKVQQNKNEKGNSWSFFGKK